MIILKMVDCFFPNNVARVKKFVKVSSPYVIFFGQKKLGENRVFLRKYESILSDNT